MQILIKSILIVSVLFSFTLIYPENELLPEPHSDLMPTGPFMGEKLDLSEKRSIRKLNEEQAARFEPKPGELLIRDFFHEGKFWVAKIPTNSVKQIYKHYIDTHTQLSFEFEEGSSVKLYAPEERGKPVVAKELKEIVYTLDPIEVIGDPFTEVPSRSLLKNFATAYRFLSPKDSYFHWITRRPSHGNTPRIKVDYDPEERAKKLIYAINKSEKLGHTKMFNFARLNCTTGMWDVLDHGHKYSLLGELSKNLRAVSLYPYLRLWMRGLIPYSLMKKGSEEPTLEDQYKEDNLKGAPEYRSRLRQFLAEKRSVRDQIKKGDPVLSRYQFKTQVCRLLGIIK